MSWVLAIVIGLLAALSTVRVEATELRIRCRDENGRKVHLSRAELLLSVWGGGPRVSLDPSDSDVVVTLDPQWLQSRWPHDPNVVVEEASLLLYAEGYATFQSEPFAWIGNEKIVGGRPVQITETEVRFPRHRGIVVREGTNADLKLKFRRPIERRLRLVDDRGSPVQGVKVVRYLFWSASNHCGGLSGAEKLGTVVSDAGGFAPVPDGDIRYAFEFIKAHYALKHPTVSYWPSELRTRLPAPDTAVRLHRLIKKPLRMHVTVNGQPAEGRELIGWASGCPGGVCAACDGQIGTTDADGMIRLAEFYPEKFEAVYFLDNGQQRIWEADPTKWSSRRTIEVELGLSRATATPTLLEATPTPDYVPLPPEKLRPIP